MSYSPKCTTARVLAAAGAIVCALTASLLPTNAYAEACDPNKLGAAIDAAGEKLRQLTVATQPALEAKMQRLKKAKGWSDQEYEEKGYAALEDERTAKLDAAANDLLSRLDRLGEPTTADPDCARINEVEAVSLELQATIRAKSQYVLSRLDQLSGDALSPAPPSAPAGKPPAIATAPATPAPPIKPTSPKPDQRWATDTKPSPPPEPVPPPPVVSQAPITAQTDGDGYTIDEIVDASSGIFGKVSANLARLLEHAFSKSGRPSGYILGNETGGAFIAGLRYGSGTLYLRSGGSMPIYWHGPSLGADIGAQGASTLFLVYKVRQSADVFSNFTGIEGSAFVVGGLGLTYMSNGRVDMAPIRSGIGLRLGANVGYVRFTSRPTWNPF